MIANSLRAILSLLLLLLVCATGWSQTGRDFVIQAEQVFEKIEALKKAGKNDEADELLRKGAAVLQKGIDGDPEFYPARMILCQFLLELKQYDAALEQLDFLLKKDSNLPVYHLLKATILIAAARFPEAEAATRQAIERDPKCKAALLGPLAVALIGVKRTPDAMAVLREACQADLSSADAVQMLALTTFHVEMYDEWEKVLRAGIALNGKERKLHDELVKGLLKLENFDAL
jgi:predicted Zn-dependent protease